MRIQAAVDHPLVDIIIIAGHLKMNNDVGPSVLLNSSMCHSLIEAMSGRTFSLD